MLFSLEEVLGDLHAPVLGSVVLSSATSWMVLRLILGDEPLFHVPPYHLVDPREFLLCRARPGRRSGIGRVYQTPLGIRARSRAPESTVWFQPAAGGLLVGIMGLFMPEVLGVGYDYVEKVWVETCFADGGPPGGAQNRGHSLLLRLRQRRRHLRTRAIHGRDHGWSGGQRGALPFPRLDCDPGAYALVGMGAAFAGIVRTPLTSVIMIFEMTRDYPIIVPLMIANLVSFFVASRLQHEPIYEGLAMQDGIHLPSAGARQRSGERQVVTL